MFNYSAYNIEPLSAEETISRALFILNNGFLADEIDVIHKYILSYVQNISFSSCVELEELLHNECLNAELLFKMGANLEIAEWILRHRLDIGDMLLIALCRTHKNDTQLMLSLSGRPNLSPMMQDYIIATKNALVISHMLKSFYDLRQGLDHSIIMEIIGIYYKNTEIMDLLFKIYADCSYYILKQMVPSIRSFHAQQAIIQRFVELEPHKIVYYQVVKSSHSFDFYISDHLQQQLSAMVRVASLANNHLDEQYMLSLLENGDLYSFIYAVAHNTESSIHAVREVICQDFGSSYSRELLKKAGISASGLAFVKRVITTLYKHVVQQYLDHQLLSEILKF